MLKHLAKKETRLIENRNKLLSLTQKPHNHTEEELMKIAREIKRKNKWIFDELKKY